jgi:hypothetical protein
MNQGRTSSHIFSQFTFAGLAALAAAWLLIAQGSAARGQAPAPQRPVDRDQAAGALVDSLFEPLAADHVSGVAKRALGGQPSRASIRPQWTARLARNPKAGDGNPPYVLIDRYGGIQRYVEPTPGIDLQQHLGQTITVRRDTGHTLLASQLDLPRAARRTSEIVGASSGDEGVRLAAAEEDMPAIEPTPADGESIAPLPSETTEGEIISEGPILDAQGRPLVLPEGVDPLYLDDQDAMHLEGCPHCGSAICQMQGGCGFGSRPLFYVRGEYLLWWFDGMPIPPLAVRGVVGPDLNTPPTPSDPTDDLFDEAFVTYGNQDILDEARSGGRVKLGYWLDDYGRYAVEGDYLSFGQVESQFIDGGDGTTPIVGRPFIDATTGLNAVEDVSFPGIRGTVQIDADSRFQSAGIRLRRALCCVAGTQTDCGDGVTCGSSVCGPMGCGTGVDGPPCLKIFNQGVRHVDVTYGVRWAQLREGLGVTEDLTVIAPSTNAGTTFLLNDHFATSNEFVGGELGFLWDWQYRRWSVELLSKLAVGNTRQRVAINGTTIRTAPGEDGEPGVGGLLAQRSNIGNHERNELSVIPELGVTLGFMVTERLKVTGGYTFLYWSRVVRPGEQIDLEVNPGNLPFADPPDADGLPDRPQFVFHDTDIWAHGLSVGLEYIW